MKYVNVKIAGMKTIRAYENTERTGDDAPDFKSDGIAVWLHDDRDAGNAGNGNRADGNRRNGAPRPRPRFGDERYEGPSLREPAYAA